MGEESGAETTCFWRPDLHLETTPASPARASASRAQAGPAAGPQFPHPPGRGEDSHLLGLSPPSGVVIYEGAAAAAAASRFSRVRLCANPQTAAHQAPRPWDSPGKDAGVGCHFLLQCMKVKSESEVAQLCPTLSDCMDRSPPGSSFHGIFQARGLEWAAIAFSSDEGARAPAVGAGTRRLQSRQGVPGGGPDKAVTWG